MLGWLEIEVLYSVDTDTINEDEKDELLENLKRKNTGETKYKKGMGYFNILQDMVKALYPGYLITQDGEKYFYTTIVFSSDAQCTAIGKPEKIYEKITNYVKALEESGIIQQAPEGKEEN